MKKILMPGMDPLSYGDRAAIMGTLGILGMLIRNATLTLIFPLPKISRRDKENG